MHKTFDISDRRDISNRIPYANSFHATEMSEYIWKMTAGNVCISD